MALQEKIKITLDVDASKADQLIDSLENVGDAGERAGEKGGAGAGAIAKGMIAAELAIATAKKAYDLFVGGMAKAVEAATQQEKVERQLALAAGKSADALKAQASALQSMTTFGDEAIIQQQAFLASLQFSEQQIMDVTSAAVDLSAATGISLESATRNLAKTYSGLSGELGELIPQLRGLTAEEMKAGKATEVIAELMKGQAANAAKDFGGSVTQAKNAFGDLMERLGALITQNPVVIEAINIAKEIFEDLTSSLGENESTFKHWMDIVGAIVIAMVETFGGLITVWKVIKATVTTIMNGIVLFWTKSIEKLMSPLESMATFFKIDLPDGVQDGLDSLKDFNTGLKTQMDEAWEAVGAGNPKIDELVRRLEEVDVTAKSTAESVGGSTGSSFADSAEKAKKKTEEWGWSLQAAAEGLQMVDDYTKQMQQEGGDFVGGIFASIATPTDQVESEFQEKLDLLNWYYEEEYINTEDHNNAMVALEQWKADQLAAIQESQVKSTDQALAELGTKGKIAAMVATSLANAFVKAFRALVSGAVSGSEAWKMFVSEFLTGLADMAFQSAAYELAEALKSFAMFLFTRDPSYKEAGVLHLKAAGAYLLVGAAASAAGGGGASASGGAGGGGGGGGGGNPAGNVETADTDTSVIAGGENSDTLQGATNITISGGTFVGTSSADLAKNVVDEINRQSRRGAVTLRGREVGRPTLRSK